MRCKLVHLDASLVQWFRNVRRRRHKTETKGGQKGINPTRGMGGAEGGAKVSFGYLRAESQSGSVLILSGDKDNALDYETSHGPGIYLFAKFIYELVRLHRNNRADTSQAPARALRESLKCKRKRAPFLKLGPVFCAVPRHGLALSATKSGRKSAIKQATKPAAATSNLCA